MKIWKLKKYDRQLIDTIRMIPKVEGTEDFWEGIVTKILKNSHLDQDEFSALYYAVAFIRTVYVYQEPQIVVVALDDVSLLDEFESKRLPSKMYDEMIQTLYTTLALEKPNGKEFCEGSLKYSDEEYKQRHAEIMDDIWTMKSTAEKYIKNLDKINRI